MKSSYDSAEHQRIRETREALRAHAIDQNNTGRTPERVIDILTTHGCTRSSALVLMENILRGDLTVTQRGIIREISKKSPDTIPPVTPVQKPEETKRVVKHTPLWEPKVPYVSWDRIARGARPGDSSWSKYHDDAVLIDQLRQAGKYPANPEQTETPSDTVKIDIDDVAECTGSGPGVVSIHPKTWEDINTLKKIGRFEIFAEEKEGLFTINFYDSLQYATITDAQGSIEEAVARILQNAQNCGYYEHIVGNKY